VDGDGIGYRTLPGTNHPLAAYFTRGTGHNPMAAYSERSDDWLENMQRLRRKMETARALLAREIPPIVDSQPNKEIGIVTFGTNEPAVAEARDYLASRGIETNYLRVRALPFSEAVTEFILQHKRVYVVENNFDGQLHQLISLEHQQNLEHVISLALGDGLPMTAHWVVEQIAAREGK
jgi:2-oxoglutarate ferredoxin oxidoreductase subunit alpha